jgi:N-carbamoylputrescine amidase
MCGLGNKGCKKRRPGYLPARIIQLVLFLSKGDTAYYQFAEPLDGPSYQTFSKLAADLKISIIVPFFERRTAGIYHNTAFIFDADGKQVGLYRKMHIPDDPAFTKNIISLPAILGLKLFKLNSEKWERLFAGTNGTPKEPV